MYFQINTAMKSRIILDEKFIKVLDFTQSQGWFFTIDWEVCIRV